MRRWIRKTAGAALAAAAVGAAVVMTMPWLLPEQPGDAFDAAELVREAGEKGVWLDGAALDEEAVYRALEAQLPYAFTMHSRTTKTGAVCLSLEIEGEARQKQAEGLAQGIVDSLDLDGLPAEERLAVPHDWLVRNCTYDIEASEQNLLDGGTAFTAYGALVDGKAVCMGYARAYQMLCEAAGVPAFFIVSEEMNHAWNAVVLDGETFFIDCTYDDPTPDRGGVSREFFLVDAKTLRQTHRWDEAFYAAFSDRFDPEKTF